MPRNAEQIEAELDAWQSDRGQTKTLLESLTAQLQALTDKPGVTPEEIQALKAEVSQLKQMLETSAETITNLQSQLQAQQSRETPSQNSEGEGAPGSQTPSGQPVQRAGPLKWV